MLNTKGYMRKTIHVNFETLTNSHFLGDSINLPYSEELERSLKIVLESTNKAVTDIKRSNLKSFILDRLSDIRRSNNDSEVVFQAIEQIIDYKLEKT